MLSIVLYHPASGVKYTPYLPGGLITSNVQVIDLPAASVRANSLYLVNVSVSSKLARGPQVWFILNSSSFLLNSFSFFFFFFLFQPYALVISGQNTYLDSFYEYSYSGSTHSSTYISTGAYRGWYSIVWQRKNRFLNVSLTVLINRCYLQVQPW